MDLKEHEAKVLRTVALLRQATRRSIAVHAGLGIVTVSTALAELLQKGHVKRMAGAPGKGGRPAHVYVVNGDLGRVAGVSLDPEFVRLVILDAAGNRVADGSCPLDLSDDPARHADDIVEGLMHAVRDTKMADAPPLLQVGVTLPGVTSAKQGTWLLGIHVTGIHHVKMRDRLQHCLGVPVLIDDPARATAIREMRQVHGSGASSFVYLFLDHGVGAGFVLRGELYGGRDGLSGEVGHLVVDPDGYRCSCGDRGCLETIASTAGILRCIRDRLSDGVVSVLAAPEGRDPSLITLQDVLQAADRGDRLAVSTLHEIGEHIGSACSTIVKLLNPDCLVLGGASAMFARYFEPRIRMTMAKHVIPELLNGLDIHFTDHTPYDEAHGVALMAIDRYWSEFATKVASRREGTAS